MDKSSQAAFVSQLITERYLIFSEADIGPRWFLENLVRNVVLGERTLLFPIVKEQADNRPHHDAILNRIGG